MSNFVNLHTHSHYSLLDGLATIDKLVEKAKLEGQQALALTDHGVMYGAIEFYQKCQEEGVKPIIGCEVYVAPRSMTDKAASVDTNPYHLVLLAETIDGYYNLMEIVSQAHIKGYYYKPRVDKELLKKYSDGLIASSACLQGEVAQKALDKGPEAAYKAAREYENIFGKGNFFLEVQPHKNIEDQVKVNKMLLKVHDEKGMPVIATKDIHYLEKDDQEAHETLLCVQMGKTLDDEGRMSMADDDFSFALEEEIKKAFPDHPEVIENTKKIADRCEVELDLGNFYLPKVDLPKGETDTTHLKNEVYKGARERYLNGEDELSQKVKDRIEHELDIIDQMDYSSYFLIVADFVKFANREGILVGPGRGSAAGSIVAYSLGITNIDPLKYDLLFERFLNPERVSQPDIDLDFADDRRDEVIRYVQDKYGEDKVAQIITFGKMEARASIRDVARALGLSYDEGDRIAKEVPFGMSLEEALKNSPELSTMYEEEAQVKRVIDLAKKLEGVCRHASVHAAGVVISDGKLTKYTPLQTTPQGDEIVTQYSMGPVEEIGLVKMDFLGLSNLTILQNALEIIEATTGDEVDLSEVSLKDDKTYELLSKGRTTGVFQLSSDGMKRYLKQLEPSRFEDIIAMLALYRPGPMDSIPEYIDAKHGRKEVAYMLDELEPILENTYGVIVYQEQVLETARELAGFSYGEADILRRAVGKKKKKLLDEQKNKFINGVIDNGFSKKKAKQLWDFIEPFARYGFNKSHAAGYGLIAYWTAYLKANYPSQFMAALLTSDKDDLDKVARDINECKEMGIKVLPPDVNESFVDFGVVKKTDNIRFGLSAIKNVGEGPAKAIVDERKENGRYESVEDFTDRLSEVVNKKVVENLAMAGAFQSIAERELILDNLEEILQFASHRQEKKASGQIALFEGSDEEQPGLNLSKKTTINDRKKLDWEKELLGIYVSSHPLDKYSEKLKLLPHEIKDLEDFKKKSKKKVVLAGVITQIQKIMTKTNEPMLFVTLEDFSGRVELLVFPSVLKKHQELFEENKMILIQGKVTFKDGQGQMDEPKVLIDKAKHIDEVDDLWQKLKKRNKKKKNEPKVLELKLNGSSKAEHVNQLKELLKNYPGKDKIVLTLPNGEKVNAQTRIKVGPELVKKIEGEFEGAVKANVLDK